MFAYLNLSLQQSQVISVQIIHIGKKSNKSVLIISIIIADNGKFTRIFHPKLSSTLLISPELY